VKPVMRKKSEHPFNNFPDFFRERDKFEEFRLCSTNATVLDLDNMSEQSLLNLGL